MRNEEGQCAAITFRISHFAFDLVAGTRVELVTSGL